MTTQFDPEQKAKLTQIINEGMGVMSEVEALNEGLSDTVKSIAEEEYKQDQDLSDWEFGVAVHEVIYVEEAY